MLSTKTELNSSSLNTGSPSPKDTPSCRWYRNIHELPLRIFIDVSVNKNLSALIIEGFPAPEDLQNAWEEIKIECSETIGDNEYRLYISLLKEVAKMEAKLQCINMAAKALQYGYYKPLADELNQMVGSKFPFDWNDQKKYREYLQKCLNRSKSLKLRIDLKKISLTSIEEVMKKKAKDGSDQVTMAYFQSILITLSDHAKYVISDSIMVFEYYERIKRLNEYIEHLKKVKNVRGAY